jgi:mannose-6-phosphate isomerase-like protein (cupin superfamily)
MPVFHARELASRKPDWLKASALGLFRVPKGDPATFDLHYHDADEIWYIVAGRARILTEGEEHVVGPGDVVCTGMGDEHHVLAVEEDLVGFYLEGELEGLKRPGHLHREEHGEPTPRRRPPAGVEAGR